MKITRTSPLSGTTRTRDLDVTPEQLSRWKRGETIQTVLAHLTPDDREFVLSGITPDEWVEYYADPLVSNR